MRAELTRQAEEHAINVFATNLRNLLFQPPLRGERVLGLDPGFRTGCKVAVVDETGKPIESTTIYPHAPQERWARGEGDAQGADRRAHIGVIAIGNGTASRETETTGRRGDRRTGEDWAIPLARWAMSWSTRRAPRSTPPLRSPARSFPTKDVTERGTISIARRLQDPLAELVKIDPQAIGVGLYQHDVDQRALATALDRVVVSCVNFAGVDVNSASAQLLRYVSGVTARDRRQHRHLARGARPLQEPPATAQGLWPRPGNVRAGGGLPQGAQWQRAAG